MMSPLDLDNDQLAELDEETLIFNHPSITTTGAATGRDCG